MAGLLGESSGAIFAQSPAISAACSYSLASGAMALFSRPGGALGPAFVQQFRSQRRIARFVQVGEKADEGQDGGGGNSSGGKIGAGFQRFIAAEEVVEERSDLTVAAIGPGQPAQ